MNGTWSSAINAENAGIDAASSVLPIVANSTATVGAIQTASATSSGNLTASATSTVKAAGAGRREVGWGVVVGAVVGLVGLVA